MALLKQPAGARRFSAPFDGERHTPDYSDALAYQAKRIRRKSSFTRKVPRELIRHSAFAHGPIRP